MLAECVSSFVTLTTLILLPKCLLRDLWFLFYHESSDWRSAYISSRSWQMPCVSTRPSHIFSSRATRLVMRESRPGGRSRGCLEDHHDHPDPRIYFSGSTICSRDEFGTLSSRHESRSFNKPSATLRLIVQVADSLGISFGLWRFPVQPSSVLTGSCCRHWSQQDHHNNCLFGWWRAHWWRKAGLVAGDEGGTSIGWSLLVPGSLDWPPRVLGST